MIDQDLLLTSSNDVILIELSIEHDGNRRFLGKRFKCPALAPFVHCSTLRPGRFSDGSYGLYYAGDSEDVALAETIHHHQNFMRATMRIPAGRLTFAC
ncbi:hypothetical protein ACVILI_005290 [Mesorhizobium sp. USDA 4775]